MGGLCVRAAGKADLPRIVELLGQLFDEPREDFAEYHDAYERAFEAIAADHRQQLIVAEEALTVVGSLVLVVVPNLGRRGRPYAIIENVIVDERRRGSGAGAAMMAYAADQARAAGCYKVSLTSRTHREGAHQFYERLGYKPASVGFRLEL
jgi:GNAT superfamily N-acetyltransferase